MLIKVCPKLPMRDKAKTYQYYVDGLGFAVVGTADYPDYLMLEKEGVELHFFGFKKLDPKTNYGQVYIRAQAIEALYQNLIANNIAIHPNGQLESKPWGQKEFSLLDPDNNLLTFGQAV